MGTWAEPENYEDLSGAELQRARCLHLDESFPSDNTVVSLYPIHGWMVGFTESRMVTLIDPFTLETKHILDLADVKPEGYFIVTVLAHGSLDANGDFWTMSVGIYNEPYAFLPKSNTAFVNNKNMSFQLLMALSKSEMQCEMRKIRLLTKPLRKSFLPRSSLATSCSMKMNETTPSDIFTCLSRRLIFSFFPLQGKSTRAT